MKEQLLNEGLDGGLFGSSSFLLSCRDHPLLDTFPGVD